MRKECPDCRGNPGPHTACGVLRSEGRWECDQNPGFWASSAHALPADELNERKTLNI